MCYLNPQEEIKSIMLKNGISYNWLADRMGTYYQKIQYAIELRKEMPLNMYAQIMAIFEKHGYIIDSSEAYRSIVGLTLKTNSGIGDELKKLNDEVAQDIADKKISPEERLRLRYKLTDMKKAIVENIDALIKLSSGHNE